MEGLGEDKLVDKVGNSQALGARLLWGLEWAGNKAVGQRTQGLALPSPLVLPGQCADTVTNRSCQVGSVPWPQAPETTQQGGGGEIARPDCPSSPLGCDWIQLKPLYWKSSLICWRNSSPVLGNLWSRGQN